MINLIKPITWHNNQEQTELNASIATILLTLNVNKTNYILFNKSAAVLTPELCLCLATDKLEKVRCTKLLSLHIDYHLEWDMHIKHCKSKLSSGMNIAKIVIWKTYLYSL